MFTYHRCLLLSTLIVLFLSILPIPSSAFYKYISSYAFLNVRSYNTPEEGLDFCVNFQQWRSRDLPTTPQGMNYTQLAWWDQGRNTNICTEIGHTFNAVDLVPADYRTRFAELKGCGFNQSVPVLNSTVNHMKFRGVASILFLVEKGKLNAYNLHNFLFSQFYNADINDTDESISIFYVYTDQFYRDILPHINDSSSAKPSELRVYQPHSPFPIDPAVVVLWLFAALSILIGSLWAASETKTRLAGRRPITGITTEGIASSSLALSIEEGGQAQAQQQVNPSGTQSANGPKGTLKRSHSEEIAQMNCSQHFTSVIFTLIFVVVVLMLAYFFREYAVLGFSVLLLFLGPVAIHRCIYALWHRFFGRLEREMPSLRQIFGSRAKQQMEERSAAGEGGENMENNENVSKSEAGKKEQRPQNAEGSSLSTASTATLSTAPLSDSRTLNNNSPTKLGCLDRPIKLMSSIFFLLALAFCLIWFFNRSHHNAFYLLDTINFMVCIYAVKASRIRSLRFLTFLLLAMFAYDLFMVFGTKLLTTDGCSVMMQVVTGVDCQQKRAASAASRSGKSYQPIAPIDQHEIPEKIAVLFYLPMLADPMRRCFDVDVEREYRSVMLGLGDVIIPGYLIAFCFYVDVIKRSRFYTYGFISIIGYSLGMASTFLALLLMETGQPALLYLVPFTLVPIFTWALISDGKQFLSKMWRGEL